MAAKKTTAGKAGKKATAGARARKPAARKPAAKKSTARKPAGRATGLEKSIEQFRESLEHSITLSRDRLQEVIDDAVKRGRMTRGDAERMFSDLLNRGRKQTDALLRELERLVKQTRRGVGGRPVRKQATQAARRARKKLS